MIAVITGDVMDSRKKDNREKWLPLLKKVLTQYGTQPKDWEIFRGDSFQLCLPDAAEALRTAIHLKAAMKTLKDKDIRMAIGIGEKDYDAVRITEANGSAFVYSGERFEELKKTKRTLVVQSGDEAFTQTINLMLNLASVFMNDWTPASAEAVYISLQYRDLAQAALAKKLKRSQSSFSERQSRANFAELMELENYYREKITPAGIPKKETA